jgi:hypothetical protein
VGMVRYSVYMTNTETTPVFGYLTFALRPPAEFDGSEMDDDTIEDATEAVGEIFDLIQGMVTTLVAERLGNGWTVHGTW